MVKVSVIIPIYNVEQYLRECLDSVLNQTLCDIELVCVNDGSTDSSLKILEEYSAKDKRIKIIDKPNSGYGHSMNVGLDNASGEYVGIVEPDDYVKNNMFETLYKKAKELDLDIIKSDFYRFTGSGENLKLYYNKLDGSEQYYNKIIDTSECIDAFKFIMNTWCGIYKSQFLKKYNIRHNETPGASFQDNGFWFQTFMYAKRAYFLNKPFYMNRRDNPNSSVKNKEKVYCMCDEYTYIRKIIDSDEKLKKFIPIYQFKRYQNYMGTFNRIDKTFKKEFVERFNKDFKTAMSNGEIEKDIFPEKDYQNLLLVINNPKKFYKKHLNKLSFLQKVFSVKNEDNSKILRVLGLKFKIKTKDCFHKIVHSHLKSFEVHLAEHCNLNCFGCNHFSPLAKESILDINSYKKDIERIKELTNGNIQQIKLLGGEPLLNNQLTEFFDVTRNIFPNIKILLVTNGILLLNQPESFWLSCAENNIKICITKYPVKIDWDKIDDIAEKYRVNIEYWLANNEAIKHSWKYPMDLSGSQNANENFLNCNDANNCIFLRDGKLFTCVVPPNIHHFNEYFGKNLEVCEKDYIDIYKAKDIDEILRFLATPIPFCRYCNVKGRKYDLPWKTSKRDIHEWS